MSEFVIPLLLLFWALSPFSNWPSGKAKKTPFFATYPRVSINGNSPASQYVHEVGGFRFGAIVTVFVLVIIGLSGLDLISTCIAQMIAIPAVFLATEKWIDLAEHGAEIMHAGSTGLTDYRAQEAERMTGKRQDYTHMTPGQFLAAVDKRKWASRIIVKLAAW